MASAIINIRNSRINGLNLELDVQVIHTSGKVLHTNLSTPLAAITPANFTAGLKTLLITYAQNEYGVTLTNSDILIFGGAQ